MKYILLFIFITFSICAYSQDFTQDRVFLNNQLPNYQKWLEQTNFSNVLTINRLEVEKEAVTLHFIIPNEGAWQGLKKSYDKENFQSLPEVLFYRMLHLFELPIGAAKIKITDNQRYFINIEFKNNKLSIREPNPKGIDDNINISLTRLNKSHTEITEDNITGNIEKVRTIIVDYFNEKYSDKYARFESQKAKYKPIIEGDNSIHLQISNITDEIIDDLFIGYYELITIDIKIEQVNKEVKIFYTLQGKYGSGVFSAPRKTDYLDMETNEYVEYLKSYNQVLKSEIRKKILEKK